MKEKNSFAAGERLYKAFIYVALISLAVIILVPVAWVFMASVKQNSEFYGNPWALPAGLTGRTLWMHGILPIWEVI